MASYAIADREPRIADDAWIAPDAAVVGEVDLGRGCSVWFGAIVRADNGPVRIGAGSNVQDGAVLHSDPDAPLTIGCDCTIGHRAVVHGATIGDGVLIGMGAVILNHAVIGDGCIVGAGAVVTERKRFGPGTLILGSPAKAVRSLDDADRDRLRAAARGYAERAERYRHTLRRID